MVSAAGLTNPSRKCLSTSRGAMSSTGRVFGSASRATYVAASFACCAPLGAVAALALCVAARSSDDPQLLVADAKEQVA